MSIESFEENDELIKILFWDEEEGLVPIIVGIDGFRGYLEYIGVIGTLYELNHFDYEIEDKFEVHYDDLPSYDKIKYLEKYLTSQLA